MTACATQPKHRQSVRDADRLPDETSATSKLLTLVSLSPSFERAAEDPVMFEMVSQELSENLVG